MTDPSIIRFREREQRERERARLAEEQQRKARQRVPQNRDSERLARLEFEWAQFGSQVVRTRHVQVRQAFFQRQTQILTEIDRMVNAPPPAPEPEIRDRFTFAPTAKS